MSENKFKKFWKRFWFIVWKDDSLKGWIISIIFLIILIRFIFFPLLSLTTGTSLPLVIVESCSMYHKNNLLSNFNDWWGNHTFKYLEIGISKEAFSKFPFRKGFNKGDILFVTGVKPQNVKVGDVIIYNSGSNYINAPIIHRVISIKNESGKYFFSTEGDANNGQVVDLSGRNVEVNISGSQIVGEPRAKILPYLGWIKLIFFEKSKPPSERGLCSTQCKEGTIHC